MSPNSLGMIYQYAFPEGQQSSPSISSLERAAVQSERLYSDEESPRLSLLQKLNSFHPHFHLPLISNLARD